jgi:hypothetical protein
MLTKSQAVNDMEFHRGECTRTVGPRGGVTENVTRYRRNGETKLWKTRPAEFRVPVKWGMRGYAYITELDVRDWHTPDECPLLDEPVTD